MLRLALCDDDEQQRSISEALLRKYLERPDGPSGRLSVFSDPRQLLEEMEEDEEAGGFDIYILDVVMPGLTGVELGMRLRERGCRGAIVYLSVSSEYAVDSYQTQAFYYLLKPVEAARLYQVLDRAVTALEKQRQSCVAVKTKQSLRLLRLDDILYAELSRRTVHYHLADGEQVDSVTIRRSFQEETAPLLADSRFLACGASFVVNLHYVSAVEKNSLCLDGGIQVPLARKAAGEATRRWSDYWLGGGKEIGP